MTAIIDGYLGKSLVSVGKFKYQKDGSATVKIPQDIVVKELIVVANGHLKATYTGSGNSTKPKVNPYGILDGVLYETSLSRKGTDRVRSYRGTRQLVSTLERLFGTADGQLYKINATSLTGDIKQGLPEFGDSGEDVAFRESITIMLENKLSGSWFPTLLNTKNLQTATLNFKFGPLSDIIDPEDSSTATIEGDIDFEVFASCSDWLLDSPDLNKADWNQNFEELEFSGVQTNNRKYITPQGMLQGMLITGLHSGKKPFDFENMAKTRLEIRYMGIQLYEGSMADFLEVDCVKTHLTNRRKGSCYISFLNNDAFNSGLMIGEGKQLELIVSTDSSLSYAQPVKLRFEYDQIQFYPTAQVSVKA